MKATDPDEPETGIPAAAFPSTCWSRILGNPNESRPEPDLEVLARTYWRPVFGYIRKQWAHSDDDARDCTQDFFVWVLDTGFLGKANPDKGRFRGFLKTSLRNFLTDLDRRRKSLKRGGSAKHLSLDLSEADLPIELPDEESATPVDVLDRMWREELLASATRRLEEELGRSGKQVYYDVFRDYFLAAETGLDYKAVAARYGITTVNVSNYLTYAKKRYRYHLRAVVRETVSSVEDLQQELDWLFGGSTE